MNLYIDNINAFVLKVFLNSLIFTVNPNILPIGSSNQLTILDTDTGEIIDTLTVNIE